MVRPYFVSVEGKYEAGPLTVFIYHARDQSCSVSLDQVESACHARAISSPALSRYEEVMPQRPILYSFRRCPYAIRARLALLVSRQTVELREVVLSDKTDALRAASPKATVPVTIHSYGKVLDHSLDIYHRAPGPLGK